MSKMRERINKLEEVIKTQSSKGNFDYDSYNLGFANGLLLAKAIITNTDPVYLEQPKKFRRVFNVFNILKQKYGRKKAK